MTGHVRKQLQIEGIVQGVGFRPFVYQTAVRLGLSGWVRNDSRGVTVEVEGEPAALDAFCRALREEHPPLASISRFEISTLPPAGGASFDIRHSASDTVKRAQISPDTFVCDDCLAELFDPLDRRHRYPFINCTNCGPRYTIVTGIPYDRPNTTMTAFPMCLECRAEYENPASRRFHAQPNACPVCGPRLSLVGRDGTPLGADPLDETVRALRAGAVVAIKGLGGYHLAVDAQNDGAVAELRRRKARDEKPFALMAADLERIRSFASCDAQEERLLTGPERPIVLLEQRPDHGLSPRVAPRNRYFGVMLPYTPLHHLLLAEFRALVMTSGNLSDEPIVFTDADARERLAGIADLFLVHDREIHIRADDSIARVMAGQALLLRRSRGFVPRAVRLPAAQPAVLAVGAELKNAFCLTQDDRAYLSQHIGDLQNAEVLDSLAGGVRHFEALLELQPQIVAHDLHPDYLSTRFAESLAGMERVAVQHHHAHLASCLAEHGCEQPAIGVIFDGIGYGDDGTVWGGEFLVGDLAGYRRLGCLHRVRMPGGDAATREPLRMALSWLLESFGEALPELPLLQRVAPADLALYRQMLARGLNSPLTSSCGRLFDAVAALAGLRDTVSYEGQAALELEMHSVPVAAGYPVEVADAEGLLQLDPRPLLRAVVADLQAGVGVAEIGGRFHRGLADGALAVCRELRSREGLGRVVLSGGVFQNRLLTETLSDLLSGAGFEVLRHSLVPPNDGGLALGQAVIAARRSKG